MICPGSYWRLAEQWSQPQTTALSILTPAIWPTQPLLKSSHAAPDIGEFNVGKQFPSPWCDSFPCHPESEAGGSSSLVLDAHTAIAPNFLVIVSFRAELGSLSQKGVRKPQAKGLFPMSSL